MKEKIAIIGGGIAGLTAAYLLSKKYDITLFEKENRIGGTAYTYRTSTGEVIDIVSVNFVTPSAANFLKLCDELNVKMIRKPELNGASFHDLDANFDIYLTSKALYAKKSDLIKSLVPLVKLMWIMRKAEKMMDHGKLNGLTYKEAFKGLPELTGIADTLKSAIFWGLTGMSYDDILNGPAELFFNIFKARGRFNPVVGMFRNYYPKQFTQSYVDALAAPYRSKIFLNSKIKSVARDNGKVTLKMEDGKEVIFDKIVFACFADQALNLLEKPTDDEKRLLGTWRYVDISTVVHRDNSSFPDKKLCGLWVLTQTTRNGKPCCSASNCTWMSPAASREGKYIATCNPNFPIKEDLIEFKADFRMPFYNFDSYATLGKLPSLNWKMNSYYCGGYFGILSSHGSAVNSAIEVAKHLGIDCDRFK